MKKKWICFRFDPGNLKKVWLMSKWVFVFMFVLVMNVQADVYSQNGRQVQLSMKEVNLKDVLWEIQRQTSFVFMYNEEDLDQVGKISIVIRTDQVGEILRSCLKGTNLTYSIQDEVIVLKPLKQQTEQQTILISGKVMDKDNNPLPGANILLLTDTNSKALLGTTAGPDGKFQFALPRGIKHLIIRATFVGMKDCEVQFSGQELVKIIMEEDKQKMDEVVVTGYANVRKTSFTGNAVSVSKDELLKTNNKSVIAALQIFDPSFRIKENTLWGSDPNALPEFNIRGESSIAMKKGLDVEKLKQTQRTNLQDNPNLPIFILDGFEVSVQKIYDMDINRIESMTILKDAAATAIYGSRAANGVVVVKTMAPKPGELSVTYHFSGSLELPDLSDYNLCNAWEKLEVERLAGLYLSDDPTVQIMKDIEYMEKMNNILQGVNTDWLAQPLRNAFNHKHSLNIQGGVDHIRYSFDLNYDSNSGVMKDSRRSRAGAGLRLDYRHKSWLQILNSVTYSMTSMEDSPYGSFSLYATLQPYNAIYDNKGHLLEKMVDGQINPLWGVENLQSYTGKGKLNDLTDNLSINLFLLNGLQLKGQFSITKTDSEMETFKDPKDPAFSSAALKEKGSLSRSLSDSYNWNVNAMLYYNRKLGHHFINATAGLNIQDSKSESSAMEFKGFQMGSLNTPAFAASQPEKTNVFSSESRLFSVLSSLNYSYDDIYLLDASFRLDGSSQFGSEKRFAPFWSFGVGINIHKYEWLKDNWLISTLKIRGSYGSTGKVNFPSYTAVTTYKVSTDSWYYTGIATSLEYLGNPELTWETTRTLDAGLSIGLLGDRVFLEGTYYRKKTVDLIDEVAIRTSSGFDKRHTNTGAVLNEGFELRLNATLYQDDDWMVVLNANLGANKNTIKELGAEVQAYNEALNQNYDEEWPDYHSLLTTPLIQYYVGASTSAIYAVRSAGIDPANGKEKFIKKGGTSTYTWSANDQVVVGDYNPEAQGAIGINLGYKGIFLNAAFMYQWGAQTYNSTLLNKVENARIGTENVDKRVLSQRWKQAGDIAPYYDLKNAVATKPTSRFVQDYNYFNFSSLSIGYDFKSSLLKKIRLKNLGIRLNANDLCRWSTVKEERGTSYPYAKTYSCTLNIGF